MPLRPSTITIGYFKWNSPVRSRMTTADVCFALSVVADRDHVRRLPALMARGIVDGAGQRPAKSRPQRHRITAHSTRTMFHRDGFSDEPTTGTALRQSGLRREAFDAGASNGGAFDGTGSRWDGVSMG